MGSLCSVNEDVVAEKIRSQDLDKENDKFKKDQRKVRKLLFLGPGDSGKSTLYKQLVTLYGKGYQEDDRMRYRVNIYKNLIESCQMLIKWSEKFRKITFEGCEFDCRLSELEQKDAETVQSYPVITEIDDEIAGVLARVWADPGIQETHKLRNRIVTREGSGDDDDEDSKKELIFQFPYDADYFFGRLDAIADPSYIPSFEDMVHSRNRTTGILESSLLVKNDPFHIVDVGGQRSERKKWIHCFEKVTGVIFVIALSDYDLKLFEDERVNRMDEALSLFEEICNSRWFQKTSTILFLNKSDLFKQKLNISMMKSCPSFANWSKVDPPGEELFDDACGYIQTLFEEKNRVDGRKVYTHITCATDTGNVEQVFLDAKDIVIRQSLKLVGLIP